MSNDRGYSSTNRQKMSLSHGPRFHYVSSQGPRWDEEIIVVGDGERGKGKGVKTPLLSNSGIDVT